MKEQLTIQELSAYLPWEVEYTLDDGKTRETLKSIDTGINTINFGWGDAIFFEKELNVKLLLLPLSSLTKEIEHKGEKFVPSIEYGYLRFEEISTFKGGSNVLNFIQLREYNILLELHFDIFGLIERGLAVNKLEI